jgi:Ca2+/Na+ antiporter
MLNVVYVQVILFTGVDNTGIVSGVGQLFPSLFLAFLLWMIKKEYDKFNTDEEEINQINENNVEIQPLLSADQLQPRDQRVHENIL